MQLTFVQPDLAKGTLELHSIIWKRAGKQWSRFFGVMIFFGVLFLLMGQQYNVQAHITAQGVQVTPRGWGFFENAACVFLGMAGFYFYIRWAQKRKYFIKINEVMSRMRMGSNECTFSVTDTELRYSSYDYHVDIKWALFKSYYEEKTWIVVESDFAVFGLDTRLISTEQKQELISFLNLIIRNQGSLLQ